MFKPDASRIAWFLNLQRILRFPRHYLAPVMLSRLRHRPEADNPDTPARGLPSFSTGSTPFRRQNHPAQAFSAPMRAATSSNARGTAAIPRSAMVAASDLRAAPLRWRAPQELSHVVVRHQAFRRHAWADTAAGKELQDSRSPHRPLGVSRGRSTRSAGALALAATQVVAPPHAFLERDPGRDPRSIATDTGLATRVANARLTSNRAVSNQNPSNEPGQLSSPEAGPMHSERPEGSRSAVSTIHIDGSALGRWAIQYLERALGKPATGMTGVDPRATIPRSRVAPF
jgi:hypothetical protein